MKNETKKYDIKKSISAFFNLKMQSIFDLQSMNKNKCFMKKHI